jgi:hypothetical protein
MNYCFGLFEGGDGFRLVFEKIYPCKFRIGIYKKHIIFESQSRYIGGRSPKVTIYQFQRTKIGGM